MPLLLVAYIPVLYILMKFIIFMIYMNHIHMITELNALKTFYELVQSGGLTRASEKIRISQSAISHSLKKLESAIGFTLYDRKKFTPTEEGTLVYKTCEEIFSRLEKLNEDLQKRQSGHLGNIRVGATVEFGSAVLSRYIHPFLEKNHGIQVDLEFHHSLLEQLLNDDLDIIIDCAEHKHAELERIPLFREEYAVVCTPRFKKMNRLNRINDLENCTILSMDKDGTWWNGFLRSVPAGSMPKFQHIMMINHLRGIINAVLTDVGVGFLPKYCISSELDTGALINPFPRYDLKVDYFSIYQKKARSQLRRHVLFVEHLKRLKPF